MCINKDTDQTNTMMLQRNPNVSGEKSWTAHFAAGCPQRSWVMSKFNFDIILYTRDLKLFWVHDPPIGGTKSALAAHRHFTQIPYNRPQVLLSLDVKHCTFI